MRHSLALSGLIASVSSFAFIGLAPTIAKSQTFTIRDTPVGTIDFIATGWTANAIRVKLNATPVVFNTTGCDPSLKDGYVVNSTQPAFRIHFDNLLMAKETGKKVSLVVSNQCLYGRPQIIGTYVY